MFPERLKKLRTDKRKTQQEIASFLGITRQGYAKYENGQSETDLETLKKLANYFGVTTDYLTGNSDDPELSEDEELQEFIDNVKVWYKDEPETKEERLRMMKKMFEVFKEDE